MAKCKHKYRIFISYAHLDRQLVDRLKNHLKSLGVEAVTDRHIDPSTKFSDEIKRLISTAHIFATVLTSDSKNSLWVHQELGYAMGIGIPILPLTLDELPTGMAREIEAIALAPDMSDLVAKVRAEGLDLAVNNARQNGKAVCICANSLSDRTKILVDEANNLLKANRPCKIRQRSAFSSFSIPDRSVGHRDFRESHPNGSEDELALLRQERVFLEKHARHAGCDLIIDPYVRIQNRTSSESEVEFKHDVGPTLARLRILREFLEDCPEGKVQVAMARGRIETSATILGDWVAADAVVPHYKKGYRQTIFTHHAPSIMSKIDAFDDEFTDIIKEEGIDRKASCVEAIKKLTGLMEQIKEASA